MVFFANGEKKTHYFIWLIALMIVNMIFYMVCARKNVSFVGVRICGFINLVTFLVTLRCESKIVSAFSSLAFFYAIIFFIFSNGELLLAFLGVPSDELIAFKYGRFSFDEIIKGGVFNSFCVIGLCFGYLIASTSRREIKYNNKAPNDYKAELDSLRPICCIIGFILMVVSIPFDVFDKVSMVIMSSRYGYSTLYSETYTSVGSIAGTLSLFCLPGCFLVALGLSNKKIVKWFPAFYLIVRCGLILIAGKRGQAVGVLIALYWFSINVLKAKKKNSIIKTIIFTYLLIAIMNAVVSYRTTVGKSIVDLFFVVLKELFSFSIIKDILNEFGFSIRPLLETMNYIDSGSLSYAYGMTFLSSFVMVIPSFLRGGLYTALVEKGFLSIEDSLSSMVSVGYGIGYSLPAECFYNLGFALGWIYMIPLGYLVYKYLESDMKRNILGFALAPALFALLVITVRSSSQLLVKYILFYYVFPRFLISIIYNKKKQKMY